MRQRIEKKLVDSNEVVSKGGRVFAYWEGRGVRISGKHNVNDDDASGIDQYALISKYSLKGFEYGNWVNNNDRHDRLIATRKSLADLARVIGSTNIGLDGMVGIAFGARGKRKAIAHFEPNTFMINLTKEKGFGSLAHEYGHALDYFFGMYIDKTTRYSALSGGAITTKKVVVAKGDLRRLMNELINEIITDKSVLSQSYTNWIKEVGQASEYWFRRNEIFARAFEMWVGYQMGKKGLKNTFLHQSKYDKGMYLTAKDFERILPKMNKLIREMSAFMKNKKILVRGKIAASK
jgi:hypothetical protein